MRPIFRPATPPILRLRSIGPGCRRRRRAMRRAICKRRRPHRCSAQPYDNQGYARPNYASQPYADPHGRPGTRVLSPIVRASALAGFAAAPAPDRPGYAPPLYPHEPEAGGMPPPHDDEFYDDEPRGGRRKGLLTVVAVLGLAVIGTAGAFGYRSMFGGAGSSAPPPVIRASGEPSKVAPPPATRRHVREQVQLRPFRRRRQGRAGGASARRSRSTCRRCAPPRTVFPGAPVPSSPARSARPRRPPTNPPSAIGEPRRVRTVPIRPEQGGDAAAAPPAQQPMTVAPPRQANAAATAPADEPPAPRAAAPKRASACGTRAPPPTAAPAPAGNAPLSLSPDANNDALPPPPAQENFPPPPRAARAADPGCFRARFRWRQLSGAGVVAEERGRRRRAPIAASSRNIPACWAATRTPSAAPTLGAKGVYYRAMVGPFGSREEAVQLCSSLKQAGGDCVVQH